VKIVADEPAQPSPFSVDPGLIDLLATVRKSTLYDALRVSPAASQEEIVAACRRLREQIRSGEHAADAATLNYAIDTLGDPARRRRYDSSLLRELQSQSGRGSAVAPTRFFDLRNRFLSSRDSRRTLAVLAGCAVVLAAAMFLSQRQEVRTHETNQPRDHAEPAKASPGMATDSGRAHDERTAELGAESLRRSEPDVQAGTDRNVYQQTRRDAIDLAKHREWERLQLEREQTLEHDQKQKREQERSREAAEREAERQRAELIGIYLGRNQFRLARETARTPAEISRVEQAEAADRRREEASAPPITITEEPVQTRGEIDRDEAVAAPERWRSETESPGGTSGLPLRQPGGRTR
jgi:curved DNA-binding protein CbpA